MMLLSQRSGYSRAEWLSDAVVHVSGVVIALMAVPVLVTLAVVLHNDTPAIAGATLYGVALILMLLCSALYNMTREARRRAFFRHLDHTAIFIKIAATYTPFTLMPGGQGGWLLTGLWGAALAGSGMRFMAPDRLKFLAVGIALAMGWAGVFAGSAFFGTLSLPVIVLIVTGGVLYTIGVAFFLFDRLPFHYTIWHIFVLAASMVFYAAVMLHLVQTAG
ncbi:hemolysin III family protein [Tabrizicola sp.]|uniref:PAQR family membrane homeostasis protein TrhA n=1 Tax=Tabrizicola sp. TaxID=2005166 RepID=UPI00286CA371|nr:hemolysin III family protein [Tabrizicola sp.]